MEDQVCQYFKYGFCKYKSNCKREHQEETFTDINCKNKISCKKRHPRVCKMVAENKSCRFNADCAYEALLC